MSRWVMNKGNIAPRAGITPMSVTFWARVLIITPPRLPAVTTLSTLNCLCGSFPDRSMRIILSPPPFNSKSFKWSFNAYNCTHARNAPT